MDTNELLSEGLEKLIHPMKKEIQEQNKIISAQKEQIQHLKRQAALLEAQKKELKDAGDLLSEKMQGLGKHLYAPAETPGRIPGNLF